MIERHALALGCLAVGIGVGVVVLWFSVLISSIVSRPSTHGSMRTRERLLLVCSILMIVGLAVTLYGR